jgi:hypothetical protein
MVGTLVQPLPQMPILDQISEAVAETEQRLQTGTVVQKANYKRVVLQQEVDTSEAKIPEAPQLAEVTVGQLMPGSEGAGRHMDLKANSAQRANCVEFILVNKVKLDGGVVVRLPNPEVFREVVGRANADLIAENTDWCLTLEYAEADDKGIGRIALNLQAGSGASRFRDLIRSYSTEKVEFETYPITAILKRHAISAYLHSGHYVRNPQLAAVIAKCNPGLKGRFTLIDVKELKPKLEEKRPATAPPPRIITLDGDREFLKNLGAPLQEP